jgi:hypothetical protein
MCRWTRPRQSRTGMALLDSRCALGGTVELPGYFARQFRNPATLARHIRRCGISILALDTSLRLIGATAVEREHLLALAPWAEALAVPRLRVFDGGPDRGQVRNRRGPGDVSVVAAAAESKRLAGGSDGGNA